jgi:hypothetical protein
LATPARVAEYSDVGVALLKLVVDAGAKCRVMARLKEHVRRLQDE